MLFFAVPRPDVDYLADFFWGLFHYLTTTNRRPLVFTNYHRSMEFFASSGATVFCPEIFINDDAAHIPSGMNAGDNELYRICEQYSPNNIQEARRNAYCCQMLPNIFDRLFRQQKPSAAIVWNFFPPFNCARAALRQIRVPTFTTDKGLLGKTTFLDREGMNGTSYFADPATWYKTLASLQGRLNRESAEHYLRSYQNALASGWEQPDYESPEQLRKRLGVDGTRRIIFVPTQVLADSNMLMHQGRFHDNSSFVRTLIQTLQNRTDIFFLVKKHPKEPLPQNEMHEVLAGKGVWTENLHTFSAIEASSVVMTLNSTVGLEAALLGKPVATFAPSLYARKGFTYDIDRLEDLPALTDLLLHEWTQSEEQREALLSFLAFLLDWYLIPACERQSPALYDKFLEQCTHDDDARGTTDFVHAHINRARTVKLRTMNDADTHRQKKHTVMERIFAGIGFFLKKRI